MPLDSMTSSALNRNVRGMRAAPDGELERPVQIIQRTERGTSYEFDIRRGLASKSTNENVTTAISASISSPTLQLSSRGGVFFTLRPALGLGSSSVGFGSEMVCGGDPPAGTQHWRYGEVHLPTKVQRIADWVSLRW